MALQELQETALSAGWQDKATGSEACVCLGRGVLNVERWLEFGNSPVVSISPLFPSYRWCSALKPDVVGCSEEGACCIVL